MILGQYDKLREKMGKELEAMGIKRKEDVVPNVIDYIIPEKVEPDK